MTIPLSLRSKAPIKFALLVTLYLMLACCASQKAYGRQFTLKFSELPELVFPNINFVKYELSTTDLLPAAKDQRIWFFLTDDSGRDKQLISSTPIILKAGESTTSGDISFPTIVASGEIGFSLSPPEAGRAILYEKTTHSSAGRGGIFLMGSRFKKDEVKLTFDSNGMNAPMIGRPNRGGNSFYGYEKIHLDHLPDHWLGYSSEIRGIITADDLIQLAQTNPQRFKALEKWLRIGGRLQVRESGEDFKKLPAVLKSFGITNRKQFAELEIYGSGQGIKSWLRKPQTPSAVFGSSTRRKKSPNQILKSVKMGTPKLDFLSTSTNSEFPRLSPSYKDGKWEFNLISSTSGEDSFDLSEFSPIQIRVPWVSGEIIFLKEALEEENQNTSSLRERNQILRNQFGIQRTPLGNSEDTCQQEFQLRDMGTPPLAMFISLVSLFMLVIGPVSYFYLKSKNRLAYQLWVVPVVSAITCLSLLGFNLMREGLSTKVRTIALVHLDQKLNLASAYTHRSIYSALTPGRYEFDYDSYVNIQEDQRIPNRYLFNSDNYTIRSNLARARTVHQIFEVRPFETNAGLKKKVLPDGKGISITNNFPDEIRLLIFKQGEKFYTTQNLPAAGEVVLKPLAASEAMKNVDWFRNGLTPNQTDYHPQKYVYWRNRNRNRVKTYTPLSDHKISSLKTQRGAINSVDDHHYWAVLETYSELGTPVKNPKQIDGSIIVHGKW